MKLLKLLTLCVMTLTVFSCSDTAGDDGSTWECQLDGDQFKIEGFYAYATIFSIDNTMAIYGSEDVTKSSYTTIYITLPDEGKVGVYDLDAGNTAEAYGNIVNAAGDFYTTAFADGKGTLEITDLTDSNVKGTFSFEAFNTDGESKMVSGGSFDVEIR